MTASTITLELTRQESIFVNRAIGIVSAAAAGLGDLAQSLATNLTQRFSDEEITAMAEEVSRKMMAQGLDKGFTATVFIANKETGTVLGFDQDSNSQN